jgi:hypothetical protein
MRMKTFSAMEKKHRPATTRPDTKLAAYCPGCVQQTGAIRQILRRSGLQPRAAMGGGDSSHAQQTDRATDTVVRIPKMTGSGPSPGVPRQDEANRPADQREGVQYDGKMERQPLELHLSDHKTHQLQRSPVFDDGTCGGQKIESKIEAYVGIASELVKNALLALENPQDIPGPLNRIFHIAPEDTLYLFLLNENLTRLEQKLAAPVQSRCRTRSDLRRAGEKRAPRAYADLDQETQTAAADAGIVYNRNIFRITGATIRREIVNTVLHEYLHLVRVGHGEEDPGAPIENKNSIKVRGLTKDEAINNAESHVRFIRAVN